MIIDSHYHFWKNSAVWDAWIEQSDVCDSKRFSSNRFGIFFFKKMGLQKIYGLNQNE